MFKKTFIHIKLYVKVNRSKSLQGDCCMVFEIIQDSSFWDVLCEAIGER